MDINRRKFFKLAGAAALTFASGLPLMGCGENKSAANAPPVEPAAQSVEGNTVVGDASSSKVYFSKTIDADHLIELYDRINGSIGGRVAIKVHSGEPHGPNILSRDMVKAFQLKVPNSTIIEANVAYGSARGTTEAHRRTLETNGWTFSKVDIIDADGDVNFPVNGGFHLKEVAMGAHLADYDSMIVLTHFKGHSMGGFGGSLKNIAIGCASGAVGKRQVHGLTDYGRWVTGGLFMELMADSGKAICDHFGERLVFINVMNRLSIDCDCTGTSAAKPTMADIGILASTDILAVDQACIDMVYAAPDSRDMIERIESREGLRQLSAMEELGMGSRQYELITVD
ncbi:MAG: DUF362 domain-containing protein [Selenomonadaceae bacterium]|nr:DUF362 domain-containing protein [Selenomonadaceae bacterium]